MGELIVGAMNCWSKNVLLWNLALDENNGPKNSGCQDCYGVMEINKSGEIRRHGEYYALAHYGKYIHSGAKRLVSSGDAVKGAAFRNPDGTLIYLGVYYGQTEKEVRFEAGNKSFTYQFKPGEVVTFRWKE